MFRNLGLFAADPCPDESCHRPNCLFLHGGPSRGSIPSSRNGVTSTTSSSAAVNGGGVKRRAEVQEGTRKDSSKRAKENWVSTKQTSSPLSFTADSRVRDGNLATKALLGTETAGRGVAVATGVPPSPSSLKSGIKPPPKSPTTTRPIPSTPPTAASRPVPTSTAASPPLPHHHLYLVVLIQPQRAPPAPASSTRQGAPSIPTNIKLSPQPWADRQKALQTLYTQFTKLYAQISATQPDLASQSALSQESEISSSSPTLSAYKTAIHHSAVSISRRPPPDSVPHPSIGTVRESREAHLAAEKAAAGRLTRDKVSRYCLPLDDFVAWGYPDPKDQTLIRGGGEQPDGEGSTQTCDRCKVPFVVNSENLQGRFGECRYHYGRTAPARVEGRRKWIYSCCGKERGEAGCEDGVHVFSHKEDGADTMLAKRQGFRTVKQVADEVGLEKIARGAFVEVVGMDCEMIYTTAGLSLGRLTIIDEEGNTLLDEIVRQRVPVLDVNTRFSGLTKTELDSAVMELTAVRAAACMWIGPETIVAGHGLENDLRALRLLHDKVIDTAILFPHDKGRPYRRALRDLVKEKLGYFIQDRTADFGHSSAEDAKATLEVLKWKVRDDAE